MADNEVKRDDAAFIQKARKRFDLAQSAQHAQRQRELDDLRFYAGDQWPADIIAARAAQPARGNMPSVPARPCLTINTCRGPVRQVLNEERAADIGIQLVPADDFGDLTDVPDDTEITLREGLIRRIQRHSIAGDARTWAFSRACIAGQGYYRVNTKEIQGSTDLEVVVQRIFNQASVTLDPSHEMPDGSDANFEFISTDYLLDDYLAEHPTLANGTRNPMFDLTDDETFRGLGDDMPGWFNSDNETRSVRVTEYFYTVGKGQARKIKWAKIDGQSILDETDWPVSFMPIVKVLGEELHPYDQQRRIEGMVRPAVDACRGKNYMVSKQVESVGLAPLPPFMVAEGQIEGYEEWYQNANTRTFPYLPYRQRDLEGNPAPMPQRTNTEVQIEGIARSVAMFGQAISDTILVPEPSLGQSDPSLRSDKQAKTLIAQARQGTSNYIDNLSRSMQYEAQIINSLLYPIYGQRPGLVTRIVTGDQNETRPVMIGQPFVMQGPKGRQFPKAATGAGTETFKLTKDANFNIAVSIKKNYDTLRQEEAATVGELIAAKPELMTVFGDLYFKNLDGPGHKEMAKRAELMLAPPIQQALAGKEPLPPAVQEQMQQAQQLIDDLTKELDAKNDIIDKERIDAQKDVLLNQQDNETKLEIAKIQAGTQLTVANLKADAQAMIEAAKAELEQLRMIVEAAQEERLLHGQQAHERIAAEHDAHLERIGAAHDAELERENATHAAAVAPATTE